MTINELNHKIFGTTPGKGVQPKEAWAYSITGIGQNFICTIIGSYLAAFMTEALLFDSNSQIGGTTGVVAVAFLMLFTRIFDAFNDPIMGSIVDRTRTKYGKCRPFLKWMAIPIGIMTILCFLPIYQAQKTWTFVLITVVYVIWSMVYTVADVPYWGLTTCMTNDTEVRGKILTIARLFCTGGAGLVTIIVPIITGAVSNKYNSDGMHGLEAAPHLKWTYFICAVVLVVVSIPMFFYGFKNTKERYTTDEKPPSLGHNLKLLFKNKPLLLLVLSGALGSAKNVYMSTGGLYFAKYALKNEGLYSIITMLAVPGGLIASLLVPYFTKRFGKKATYIFTHLMGAAAMFIMYFIGYSNPDGSVNSTKLLICALALVIIGIPSGVANVMTYAMIGDSVEYLEWKTGERAEGICFSMQTFINKLGLAMSAFVGVIAYGMAGISPSNPQGNVIDAAGCQTLWTMLILTGAISFALCVVPMFFYNLSEKRQRKMVAEIEERKAAKANNH